MPNPRPQTLSPESVRKYCAEANLHQYARSQTKDGTQIKAFWIGIGETLFVVSRRYKGDGDGFEEIYRGSDLETAVRRYNALS